VFGVLATRLTADSHQATVDVRTDEAQRAAVIERASRSVVCIFADRERGGGGSGVLIGADGYGLTNYHVAQSFIETRRGYGGLADGNLYRLRLLGIDPGGDIAMFRLEGRDAFEPAPLGDSDALRVGQRVLAIGNPFLVAEDFMPTVTLGVVSGLHRYQSGSGEFGSALEYADCIQVSSSINPGNSGGPLFDLNGRVVGIIGRASFDERGRVNVGLGYAVSIRQVLRFLPALRAGRLCFHGTLGATARSVGAALVVDAVQDLSPAERCGIELGDEMLVMAGRELRTPNDLNNILATLPADWPVSIRLRRGDRDRTVATRLERLPLGSGFLFLQDPAVNQREWRRIMSRYSAGDLRRADPAFAGCRWTGRMSISRDDRVDVVAVHVSQSFPASIRAELTRDGRTETLEISTDQEAPHGSPAAEAWRDARFWSEWQHVIMPLLAAPRTADALDAIGGDELSGRIVCICEQRLASGRRFRWKFCDATGELVGVSAAPTIEAYEPFLVSTDRGPMLDVQQIDPQFRDPGEQCAALWTPAERRPAGPVTWPHAWTRRSADGAVITIDLDAFEPLPAAATPSTEPPP
jgi:S1-C subfamily serine protease